MLHYHFLSSTHQTEAQTTAQIKKKLIKNLSPGNTYLSNFMPTEVTLIISNEYLHDLSLTKQLTPDFPYRSQGLTFTS